MTDEVKGNRYAGRQRYQKFYLTEKEVHSEKKDFAPQEQSLPFRVDLFSEGSDALENKQEVTSTKDR